MGLIGRRRTGSGQTARFTGSGAYSDRAARAAARQAMGTRYGEQLT
jgi:hypothetical protein